MGGLVPAYVVRLLEEHVQLGHGSGFHLWLAAFSQGISLQWCCGGAETHAVVIDSNTDIHAFVGLDRGGLA